MAPVRLFPDLVSKAGKYHQWKKSHGVHEEIHWQEFEMEDLYATCEQLMKIGFPINRPPRDGHMAFVRSPDNISIELLQKGEALPVCEPWASMENIGHW